MLAQKEAPEELAVIIVPLLLSSYTTPMTRMTVLSVLFYSRRPAIEALKLEQKQGSNAKGV